MSRKPVRMVVVVGLAAALAVAAAVVGPVSAEEAEEAPTDVVAATYREVTGQKTVTLDQLEQLGPPPWLSLTEDRDPAVLAAWEDLARKLDPSTFASTAETPTTTEPPPTTEPPATTTEPPATTTEPPATTTEPPATTTEPPATTTEPPATTTEPPATTTEPPPSTTEPPPTTLPPPDGTEVSVTESEPPGQTGLNDTVETGDPVNGFGTGDGELHRARIFGNLIEPPPPDLPPLGGTSVEDDGAIPLANPTGLVADTPLLFTGAVGDGPFGLTSGDFDHYALGTIEAGQVITLDTESAGLDFPVDTVVALYDSAGFLLALNDDDGSSLDSFVQFEAPATGEYFASVFGFGTFQVDPFDSGSGEGAFAFGDYQLILSFGAAGPASIEDDGAIPLANPTGLAPDSSVVFSGFIGDGPFGATSGDYDFYALGTVDAGTFVTIDTTGLDLGLDTVVALYDSTGTVIGVNDDGDDFSLDSRLVMAVPATGDYFALVHGFGSGLPADPFDSASGAGPGTPGLYRVELALSTQPVIDTDVDVFLVDLAPGDAVSVGLIGAAGAVSIVDPLGVPAQKSPFNVSWIYPPSSPLRHQGDIGADHVAADGGVHAIVVEGLGGDYQGEIRVERAGLRSTPPSSARVSGRRTPRSRRWRRSCGGGGSHRPTRTPSSMPLWPRWRRACQRTCG
jgi:hypothetical protein